MFAQVGHLRGRNWLHNSRGERRRVFLGVAGARISFCRAGGAKVYSRVVEVKRVVVRGLVRGLVLELE